MWATLFNDLFAPLLVVALFATGRVDGNYKRAPPPTGCRRCKEGHMADQEVM